MAHKLPKTKTTVPAWHVDRNGVLKQGRAVYAAAARISPNMTDQARAEIFLAVSCLLGEAVLKIMEVEDAAATDMVCRLEQEIERCDAITGKYL